jgi:uncharacterized protein YbjT (DUF2867 family)
MNLVVGSSGMLGGMVARRLLAGGKPVRVLVRQPSSLAGAESVTGDLKDPASLEAACRGVNAVITTANSARRGGADNIESVAVDDVAEFVTRVVDHPAAIGQRILVGGPDALSWSGIAAKTAEILGRPVPVRSIEPGQPIPSLPPPIDAAIGGLAAGLEQQDVVFDSTTAAQTFGVTLTPASAVLKRLLAR